MRCRHLHAGSKALAAMLATLAVLLLSPGATARPDPPTFGWKYTIVVPPGLMPNDLHVTFSGTGGTIKNVVVVPAAAAVGVTGGNTIDVTWADKLKPGTVVCITFTTSFSPVDDVGGTWTNDGEVIGNIGPDDGTTEPTEVTVPTMSEVGLAVLGLILVGAAALVICRRV